jgi:hypothetical protein
VRRTRGSRCQRSGNLLHPRSLKFPNPGRWLKTIHRRQWALPKAGSDQARRPEEDPPRMLTQREGLEAHALRERGWAISVIARHLERDRKMVRANLDRPRGRPASGRRPASPATSPSTLGTLPARTHHRNVHARPARPSRRGRRHRRRELPHARSQNQRMAPRGHHRLNPAPVGTFPSPATSGDVTMAIDNCHETLPYRPPTSERAESLC